MIKTIGRHKVTNASIDDKIVDTMLAGEKVSVFYSDPPWGDGNLKYWVTMNKKMTGAIYNLLTYRQLIGRISSLIKCYVDGQVFIETGPRWGQETIDAISGLVGGIRVYRLKYKSGSKMLENLLIYGTTGAQHKPMQFDPTGMHGLDVPRRCIESIATPGGIVLDPCCGMGYTARSAVAAGMAFRGNEFNAKRLQKTIDFLNSTI